MLHCNPRSKNSAQVLIYVYLLSLMWTINLPIIYCLIASEYFHHWWLGRKNVWFNHQAVPIYVLILSLGFFRLLWFCLAKGCIELEVDLLDFLFSFHQYSDKGKNIGNCLNLLCSDLRRLSEVKGNYLVVSPRFFSF